MTGTVAPRTIPAPGVGLPERLRRDTAECHREVEASADIAGSMCTPADYVQLLLRLYALHAGFERLLAADVRAPGWARGWADVGVCIAAYQRARQLTVDLEALGETGIVRAAVGDVPVTFLTGGGRAQNAPWAVLSRGLRRFEDQGGDGDSVVSWGAGDLRRLQCSPAPANAMTMLPARPPPFRSSHAACCHPRIGVPPERVVRSP